MRDIVVPTIINTGVELRRKHYKAAYSVLAALLIYILLLVGVVYGQYLPLFLLRKPVRDDYTKKQSMQYVQIDDKLINEKIREKTDLKAMQSRASRGTVIDKSLPKTGPKALEKDKFQSFKEGKPIASVAALSAVSPAQQPTQPTPPRPKDMPQKPMKPVQPTPPAPKVEAEKAAIAKIENDAPELNEEDFAGNAYSSRAKSETTRKTVVKSTQQKPEKATKTQPPKEEIAKTHQKEPEQPKQPRQPQQQKKRVQPQKAQKPQPKRPIKIPVRRIGSSASARGGKIGLGSSSAMKIGSRSMAVLYDRYGHYMQLVLRRIQQAIILQRQLSPIFFQEGTVIMTFSINPNGRVDNIRYVRASRDDLNTEIAASRRVLEDVANGKPLPPPSQQMLNDPDFKRITINFVFQQF